MEETSEKIPVEAYSRTSVKPRGYSCLRRTGIAAFITGAVLLLFGAVGAFYLRKTTEKEAIGAFYSRSIDGKMIEDDSMEVNSENNLERVKTANGDGKAMEAYDFKAGITAIKFPGGEKCYIKSQVKSKLSEEKTIRTEESNVDSQIWVTSDEPLKDKSFLGVEILRFCGDLPVHWQHPVNPSAVRKRRHARRMRRQHEGELNEEQMTGQNTTSNSVVGEEEEVQMGSAGSAFNPENPYHRNQVLEEGNMVFDPMLDHRGICCTECQRSYTQCERVCEPLGGYWPWPYNYQGCRVACRVIMPCHWWVARILGLA